MIHNVHKSLEQFLVPIDSLIQALVNPRVHDDENLEDIRTSLRTFGQDQLVVGRSADNTIVKGNGRHQAMKLEGWTHCAAIFVDDDEIKAMARGIADNRSSDSSDWDNPILLRELKLLESSEWIQATGYSESEIDALAKKLGQTLEENENGRQPFETASADALIEKWSVQAGKVWQIGQHRLICADSSDAQSIANLMRDQQFAMMFTELPEDHDSEFLQKTLSSIRHGIDLWTCYICGNDHYLKGVASLLNIRFTSPIIWIKNRTSEKKKGFYKQQHDLIHFGGKGANSKDRWFGADNENSTWQADVIKSKIPQQPVIIPERAIKNSTNIGEIVFDPFGGAGTTMVAAHLNSRAAYLSEIDPAFCGITLERMSRLNLPISELENENFPIPPEPETWHARSFSFSQAQHKIVQEAIDRVSATMDGNNTDARAIELICGDFLAGS
jgi:DNA modification methylase